MSKFQNNSSKTLRLASKTRFDLNQGCIWNWVALAENDRKWLKKFFQKNFFFKKFFDICNPYAIPSWIWDFRQNWRRFFFPNQRPPSLIFSKMKKSKRGVFYGLWFGKKILSPILTKISESTRNCIRIANIKKFLEKKYFFFQIFLKFFWKIFFLNIFFFEKFLAISTRLAISSWNSQKFFEKKST